MAPPRPLALTTLLVLVLAPLGLAGCLEAAPTPTDAADAPASEPAAAPSASDAPPIPTIRILPSDGAPAWMDMPHPTNVSGIVLKSNDLQPAENATARLMIRRTGIEGCGSYETVGSAATDASGRFEPIPYEYRPYHDMVKLLVTAGDEWRAEVPVVMGMMPRPNVTVVLRGTGDVVGHAPPGAAVLLLHVIRGDDFIEPVLENWTLVPDDGAFRFPDVIEGHQWLLVAAPGEGPKLHGPILARRGGVDAGALDAGGEAAGLPLLVGRAVNEWDGTPLAGFVVYAERGGSGVAGGSDDEDAIVAAAVTDSDGGFRIVAPGPGTYLLRARPPQDGTRGFDEGRTEVVVDAESGTFAADVEASAFPVRCG